MNMIPIIYENDELLIINKPAGLAVQGGQVGYKIYLVHRLDKDTSGLMVVTKNPVAAGKWTKLIGSKVARKEYLALCAGRMPSKSGVIKEDVIQHGDSKAAVTHYQVEKEWTVPYENENGTGEIPLCLIRLQLETGRMHQIRIHLAKQGCPIAGDDQHGNFKVNKILKKTLKVKKLLLASVKLTMPLEGKEQTFEINLPDYMKF